MNESVSNTVRLVVIVDRDYCGSDKRFFSVLEKLASLHGFGKFEIQVRIKGKDATQRRSLALKAKRTVNGRVPIFLNANPKDALDLRYDGVHLVESAHNLVPEVIDTGLAISVACHSMEGVIELSRFSDLKLFYSPVFKPNWKSPTTEVKGILGLSEAVSVADGPVFALGGITPRRAQQCLHAGAQGVVVLSGIIGATNLANSLRSYLNSISSYTGVSQ